MKKKIIGGIVVMAIAALAAFNVNFSIQENELSEISLANVEALADSECTKIAGSCWEDWSICCDAGYFGCSPCGT